MPVVAAVAALLLLAAAPAPAGAQQLPHEPTIAATPTSTVAQRDIGLRVDVRRQPGHLPIGAMTVSLPDGLLGRLLAVPFCADEQALRGTCPAASRIGRAELVAETPEGLRTLAGTLSLAGPTDTALARMVLSLPGLGAGRIVIPGAVRLGERDGRVQVALRVPRASGGVALELRRMTLDITYDGFLFNPSGCAGRTIDAVVEARTGEVAAAAAPYPVTGCGALPFAPGVRVFNEDRSTRARGSRPPLTLDFRPRATDASMRDVEVAFPRHLQPNIELLQSVCNPQALAERRCPAETRIATARATSPLIPDDLEGPVILAFPDDQQDTAPGLELPNTTMQLSALHGLIRLRLDGRLRLRDGRLVSTFTGLPDVPLTSFTLELDDTNFIAARALCAPGFDRASIAITGHNDRRRTFAPAPQFAACQRIPLARVTMERVRSAAPEIVARVERAPQGARLRRVNLTLPDALAVRRTRSGVTVRVGDRVLPRRHWSLSRSAKRLRISGGLGGSGAERVTVALRDGAVVAGPRTRERARRGALRLAFRVSARDTAGRVATRTVSGYDEAWVAPTG